MTVMHVSITLTAIQFQNILNKQHNKIQYTIDKEDGNKVLQFLDSRWLTLNKQHNKIQYTIDKEDGNKVLQFLDIKVINTE